MHLIVKQVGKPIRYFLAIAWTIFILVASGISSGTVKDLKLDIFFLFDKIGHGAAYMMYVIFWAIAFSATQKRNKSIWIAFVTSVLLGITLEIMQKYLFIGRSADFLDMLANISGSIVGTIIFIKLVKT